MTTRLQAAELIAAALENDYSTSVWAKGSEVRVYLTKVQHKSKGRVVRTDNGYLSITRTGEIDTDHLDRQAGAIATVAASLNLTIEAEAAAPVVASQPVVASGDESLDQLADSERQIAAREFGRELG